MQYYSLRCETCSEDFSPLLATSPEELTAPDYDEVREQAGPATADRLEAFHAEHRGHALAAVALR